MSSNAVRWPEPLAMARLPAFASALWRAAAALLAAAALAGLALLPAPAAATPARTLRFEHLSVDQGLAQESVLAITQDRDGFIWIGSQAGLSRFDGYRVTVYRNNVGEPASLANNWVRVLHVDAGGRLWVGTDGGLDRFEPASQGFTHFAAPEPVKRGSGSRHVRAIAGDGGAGLWIASSDGLQHFDPASGAFTVYHHDAADPSSLADDQVNALAVDAAGTVWIGTATGLDSLARGARRFIHHRAGAGDGRYNAIETLLVDAGQTLWIGSLAGLETWKLGTPAASRRRLGEDEGLSPGRITALLQDVDANVWVGSHADGVYRWAAQSGRFANYRHQGGDVHSVADNQISSLFRDRVGTFWVGTWFAGASRVDLGSGGFARLVRQPEQADTLLDNKVRAILDDGHGKLWLATNTGLNLLDPDSGAAQTWRHDPAQPNSLGAVPATALARDRHGRLWVGGSAGVTRFDPASGRFTPLALAAGDIDANNVRGMLADRAGALWVASRGGLHKVDVDTLAVHTYRHDPANGASLADNSTRPLLEDRAGRLWVGTFDGLDLFDRARGTFRHYRHNAQDPASLSHDEVHYLLEARDGALWVGTAAGLNRMALDANGNARFTRYTAREGMLDDAVAAVLEDAAGRIWISTNTGIARLDPASGRGRHYSAVDGTIEGAYFDGAAARTADGSMYFGGFNGITAFLPTAISDNLIAPRAVITGFQIFNKPAALSHPGLFAGPIERASAVTLDAADSVFSLEFSALHYAAPQRNRFAYQLEGFDRSWVATDATKRFATYTNLDPGRYVFRVKAANKDGVWSDAGASLAITIRPPWWGTWWFRALATVLVAGAIWGSFRARVRALRRQQEMLGAQVAARTHEIALQNTLLERQKGELDARRRDAEQQRAEAEQRRSDAERQMAEVERQKENVELAHRNISILSEIGREMTATLDMETIMSTVYRHVHHLMDARTFGIGFVREELGLIEFPYSIDEGRRSKVYARPLDDPDQFAVWCIRERREIFINDLAREYGPYLSDQGVARITAVPRPDGAAALVPVSIMYVPLMVKERVMGVLCVQSGTPDAYQRVHLDMLQTLAAHAAVALDNARAYRQLEQTQAALVEQERQVRENTFELALANRALQDNDERLRLAKRKAEDATRQKSEFLANMSHEMRTPLAGVIGMLGFALRDGLLASSTREQILRGQANAQSLLGIINDLLDFSKIEAGKLTIENIDFALRGAVDNVVSLFEEQAAAHSVDFAVELASDLPDYVVGDPTRLRQVLVNLVGNAFKFTNEGVVTLSVAHDGDAAGAPGPHRIRFTVHDTGIGIAPAALARLFQKFEQADSTTTRRYGGTGLGLAICRQLVELMGGQIEVASVQGQGSSFAVVLPLADGVAPPPQAHVARAPHSHRLRVLCAEDFPTNQIIIRMMLEEAGHLVDIADNGLLAVAACAHTRYDLILMDGRMPEMDGASATRLIRAGGPAEAPVRDAGLMIVALTANASEEDRARYLACGMDDFLTKPIDEAALHATLSDAIARQLGRGVALAPMAGRAPSTLELDAMFGVSTGPAALPAVDADSAHARSAALKVRMRAAFAADLPSRRADLDAAIVARDGEAAGRLLHGIKGSAAYLDASALHLLCGALETAADGGHWDRIDAELAALRALLDAFADAPA
jgi:signal transduction histidine kinase/ligand-binding sensor domain-containing protein/CheY-like chemotaxis protein/HPt (histidine-containing phosphotransfer) domain-containing protein